MYRVYSVYGELCVNKMPFKTSLRIESHINVNHELFELFEHLNITLYVGLTQRQLGRRSSYAMALQFSCTGSKWCKHVPE